MADEQKGTEYVVLRREGGGTEGNVDTGESRDIPESWHEVGRVKAANDVAAIRAISQEMRDNPDTFEADLSNGAVAVPARSWRVRTPQKKVQETTLWT